MENVSLTLRPPPNVDFVHGFPGIPPAADRPQAIVKSDALSTVVLANLELALKETMRLHPNNFAGVRRVQAQKVEKVVVSQVAEVNATLYGGTRRTVELSCTLNPNHTTPTPGSPGVMTRPTPQPPVAGGSGAGRVLTAAEEKALLKAKYDAQDAAGGGGGGGGGGRPTLPPPRVNGNGSAFGGGGIGGGSGGLPSYSSSAAAPPPLMPRPPAEYIQETKEEDERVSKLVNQDGVVYGDL